MNRTMKKKQEEAKQKCRLGTVCNEITGEPFSEKKKTKKKKQKTKKKT